MPYDGRRRPYQAGVGQVGYRGESAPGGALVPHPRDGRAARVHHLGRFPGADDGTRVALALSSWLLALTVLAVYAVGLLVGFLAAAAFLGDLGLRLLGGRREPSRGARLGGLLAALALLALVWWIPAAGGLVLLLALLLGFGALMVQSYRAFAGGRPATLPAAE